MGCGANCARYLLFIFNLIFFLGGCAVAVVGGIILGTDFVRHSEATLNKAANYDTLAIVLIVIGVTVLLIAFLGCGGAVRKNHCMLVTFAGLILLIVIAQVVIGVLAILMHNKAEEEFVELGKESLQKTNGTDHSFMAAWNWTQEHLKCCGVEKFEDWTNLQGTPYSGRTTYPEWPDQCCANYEEGCGLGGGETYSTGCIQLIIKEFKSKSLIVGLVALVIGLLELMGVVFAWCVATQVKREQRAGY